MTRTLTIRVDAKGRLTLPRRLRKILGIKPGDEVEMAIEGQNLIVRSSRRENPFDALAAHALAEYRAGRTQRLRALATSEAIDLERVAQPIKGHGGGMATSRNRICHA